MLTANGLDSFDKVLNISGINVPTPKIHADDMEHGVAYDVDAVDFTPDANAEKLSELGHYEAEAKAAASSVEDILVPPKSVGGSPTKGYSDYADGMSPEDATRYIANNEAKFYGEFSEIASASGLNSSQIAETYDAMRSGDYTKMASCFDTSSPHNGAVFWSGNKDGAGQYAQSIGGTIMEQTQGGQVFNDWRGLSGMYPEWDTGVTPQILIWEALSSQYANGATGTVTYAHPVNYLGNMWINTELQIIIERIEEGFATKIMEVFTDGK